MENTLIDVEENENNIKEINGLLCFQYKMKYKGERILKTNKFKLWLKEEKRKKGNKDLLYYCDNCNIFCYFQYQKERLSFKCLCNLSMKNKICTYCGYQYYGAHCCCARRGFKESFKYYLLNGRYTCNINKTDGIFDCMKAYSCIFNFLFIGTIYCGLFYKRLLKKCLTDKNIDCYEYKNNSSRNQFSLSNISLYISILFILVYCIIYYVPFTIIYFIYLIIFFKNYDFSTEDEK